MTSRTVSKEEFNKFLEDYPNPLDRDVNHIFEPPAIMYSDFSKAEGYEAVVCFITTPYDPKKDIATYHIMNEEQ